MSRLIKVAAAQLGPNNEGTSREDVVQRMDSLLEKAIQEGVKLLAYPEMALTPYFPKHIRKDFEQFFENEIPPRSVQSLLNRAGKAGVAVYLGFCERAGEKHFNTVLLTDRQGRICATYRKTHLPGKKTDDGVAQVHEPLYFDYGDSDFKVLDVSGARVGIAICQDRRYPETYRCLALLGAEIIVIGYNTVLAPLALDLNELSLRSGAYANGCFVMGIAKAGLEDGVELVGGSCVISPQGQVLRKAATNGDELVAIEIDLDQITAIRKRWNFLGRRRPDRYASIVEPVKEKEEGR
jgi:N-carbamoyl-D-amino-acid hydrolase